MLPNLNTFIKLFPTPSGLLTDRYYITQVQQIYREKSLTRSTVLAAFFAKGILMLFALQPQARGKNNCQQQERNARITQGKSYSHHNAAPPSPPNSDCSKLLEEMTANCWQPEQIHMSVAGNFPASVPRPQTSSHPLASWFFFFFFAVCNRNTQKGSMLNRIMKRLSLKREHLWPGTYLSVVSRTWSGCWENWVILVLLMRKIKAMPR